MKDFYVFAFSLCMSLFTVERNKDKLYNALILLLSPFSIVATINTFIFKSEAYIFALMIIIIIMKILTLYMHTYLHAE